MKRDRYDRHHLLFPRQEWELRPEGKRLRQTMSLMPLMKRSDHEHVHDVVPLVPLLGYHTLMAVPHLWQPVHETFSDIDSLCLAIDHASKPHRTHQLERDLAGLAIEALMMEKQVLKEVGIYG